MTINTLQNKWNLKCEVCGQSPATLLEIELDSANMLTICSECVPAGIEQEVTYMSIEDATEFVMSDECKPIFYNRQLEGYDWQEIRQDVIVMILEGKKVLADKPHSSVKFLALNATRKELRRKKRFSFHELNPEKEGYIRFVQLGNAYFTSTDSVIDRLDLENFLKTLTDDQYFIFTEVLYNKNLTYRQASEVLGYQIQYHARKIRELAEEALEVRF